MQNPLAAVYDAHDSVSLVSDEIEMSVGSNVNSAGKNDKFSVVFGLYLNHGVTAQQDQI